MRCFVQERTTLQSTSRVAIVLRLALEDFQAICANVETNWVGAEGGMVARVLSKLFANLDLCIHIEDMYIHMYIFVVCGIAGHRNFRTNVQNNSYGHSYIIPRSYPLSRAAIYIYIYV